MVVHEEFIKNSFLFSWNNISSISISLISKSSPKFKFSLFSNKISIIFVDRPLSFEMITKIKYLT